MPYTYLDSYRGFSVGDYITSDLGLGVPMKITKIRQLRNDITGSVDTQFLALVPSSHAGTPLSENQRWGNPTDVKGEEIVRLSDGITRTTEEDFNLARAASDGEEDKRNNKPMNQQYTNLPESDPKRKAYTNAYNTGSFESGYSRSGRLAIGSRRHKQKTKKSKRRSLKTRKQSKRR